MASSSNDGTLKLWDLAAADTAAGGLTGLPGEHQAAYEDEYVGLAGALGRWGGAGGDGGSGVAGVANGDGGDVGELADGAKVRERGGVGRWLLRCAIVLP